MTDPRILECAKAYLDDPNLFPLDDLSDSERERIYRVVERVVLKWLEQEPTSGMDEATYNADLDIYWSYNADGRPGSASDVYRAMCAQAKKEIGG